MASRGRHPAAAHPLGERYSPGPATGRKWTAKELGQHLGVAPNGLHYHLRVLEEGGLIRVDGGRSSGRIIEKAYRAVEDDRIAFDARDGDTMAALVGGLLDIAKIEVADAVYENAGRVGMGEEPLVASVNSPGFATTHAEASELYGRMLALVTEFRDRARVLRGEGDAQSDVPEGWSYLRIHHAVVERPYALLIPGPPIGIDVPLPPD